MQNIIFKSINMHVIRLLILFVLLCTTMARSHHNNQQEESQELTQEQKQHDHHRNHHHRNNHNHKHNHDHHNRHHRHSSNRNINSTEWRSDSLNFTNSNVEDRSNTSTRLEPIIQHPSVYNQDVKIKSGWASRNYNVGSFEGHERGRRRPKTKEGGTTNVFSVDSGENGIYPRRDVEDFDDRRTWRHQTAEETTPTTTVVTTRPTKIPRNYHKPQDGRHICVQHKTIQVPIKTTEIYTRPVWRHFSEPCQVDQVCTRVKLVHEPAYRDVIRHKTTKQVTYDCCPGWEQISKAANGCTKPICTTKCRNGGTCLKPDMCSCPPGFSGKFCEKDVNECKEDKPCDQLCYNTDGSYYCACREGFILGSDKQSCKKIGGDNNAFEARDLENEVDNDEVGSRLHKIEKMLANDRVIQHDLQKSVQSNAYMVDTLKTRISSLERRNQDLSYIQQKLQSYDAQTRKLEDLVNLLYKCRTKPSASCP